MVEEIITGLSRIKWLFVIARNSSFAYKGKSPDIRQVGRELGVRYVLEGSVRRASGRVRITGNWSRRRPAGISGPNATTARSTMFLRCRTRSQRASSAPSSRACARPRSSASNASGQTVWMPTT